MQRAADLAVLHEFDSHRGSPIWIGMNENHWSTVRSLYREAGALKLCECYSGGSDIAARIHQLQCNMVTVRLPTIRFHPDKGYSSTRCVVEHYRMWRLTRSVDWRLRSWVPGFSGVIDGTQSVSIPFPKICGGFVRWSSTKKENVLNITGCGLL